MKQAFTLLLLVLCLGLVALAEPLPLTIWQKEKRFVVQPGQVVKLQRAPFIVLSANAPGQHLDLMASFGPQPEKDFAPFGGGQGMAGPYDGLFLTWRGFHYFHISDSPEDSRMKLWDRKRSLYYWECHKLYDNRRTTHPEAKAMDWTKAPSLELWARKQGYEDLKFRIQWFD